MTTFHLMSDLHLEFEDLHLPGGEVLILAGDILVAAAFRLADNANQRVDMANRFRRFIREELPKYQKVIYVCGNHEFYHNDYYSSFDIIRKELPANTVFLENESCVINDVHVFGATLWTDMNKGNPVSILNIRDSMNEYSAIKHKPAVLEVGFQGREFYTSKFTTTFSRAVHRESVSVLKDFLAEHKDDKILVVTHHAPCELSIDKDYGDMYHLNGAYYSDLTDLILGNPCIKTWVHGHIHCRNDYQIGDCRILSNPRGYPRTNTGFDINFKFDL